MKPVPVPCGTSSDVPPWPNGTAVSFVTWTVAGLTLSTTPDRLGTSARAVVVPAGVEAGVEPGVDAVTVTLGLLDALSGCFGWSLSEPPQATRKRETITARK